MHANPQLGSQSAGLAAAMYAANESPAMLLNERDAAKLLGVSPRTLWALRKAGRIPFVALSPRCVRYARTALVAWITSQSSTEGGAK